MSAHDMRRRCGRSGTSLADGIGWARLASFASAALRMVPGCGWGSSRRWLRAMCFFVGLLGLSVAAGGPVLAAVDGSTWRRASRLALPPGAATAGQSAVLSSVACVAVGSCEAVGLYATVKRLRFLTMAVSEAGGVWRQPVALRLPPGADLRARQQYGGLYSIACIAAGSCVAVGAYSTNESGVAQPAMIALERHGIWDRATRVTLPMGADVKQSAELDSVTCPGGGFCEAVGSYTDRQGAELPMVVREIHGVWGDAVQLPLPAHAERTASLEVAGLDSVSCPRVGFCEAVGYFTNQDQRQRPMVAREIRRVWVRGAELSLPADASATADAIVPGTGLNSVACTGVGACEAVGQYPVNRWGNTRPMVASETAGVWHRATRLPLLPTAAERAEAQQAYLDTLSCPNAEVCEAAGSYTAAGGKERAMVVSETHHHWIRPSTLELPRGADADQDYGRAPHADSIACVGVDHCEAVGSYLARDSIDAMTATTVP
jgi:hypothetical protein